MDAEELFQTLDSQREYLGEWLPFVATTLSLEDSISFINSIVHTSDEKEACVYTIRKGDEFAGIIGAKGIDFANKKTEFGYWLSEKFQGQGIMTRCVRALCQRAFTKMDINRIQIKCAVGNDKSSAIPKRLGFTLEGIERQGERMSNGEFVDLKVFSLLKSDFKTLMS